MRAPRIIYTMLLIVSCMEKKVEVKRDNSIKETVIKKEDPSEKKSEINIYLTFDDGPYMTTPNLLSRLERQEVKSSFFIVGSQVTYSDSYDSIFRNIKKSPFCKIYNHTYSHAVTHGRIGSYYEKPSHVYEDINRNKPILNTGGNITRLPGLNTWRIGDKKVRLSKRAIKLIEYLDSNKIRENIIGWDVEWKAKHSKDKNQVNSLFEEIKRLLTNQTSEIKDVVILSHDYLYKDDESLNNLIYFIERLKKELNCSFKWIEEMDGVISE